MLFDPARHQPLTSTPWDPGRAEEAIRDIAEDALRAMAAGPRWPLHPLDDEGDEPAAGFQGMYLGSAGILHALWRLQARGTIRPSDLDVPDALARVRAIHLAARDAHDDQPSHFVGEAGLLFAAWLASRSPEIADRLQEVVAANVDNPSREAFLGASGTMLPAWHLWRATGEPRWAELFRRNVESVMSTCEDDPAVDVPTWTQAIHGTSVRYLGAGHGFAGNVFPLLLGDELLDEAQRERVVSWCERTLGRTAVAEEVGDEGEFAANWPPGLWPGAHGKMLVQWCHGAPGIVTSMSPLSAGRSAEIDGWVLKAGRAVWLAGPLAKGAGLCHGTAGNGQALLALNRRTGDDEWLHRAQRFAMHAIEQVAAARTASGQGRHSLWTGDLGVALFLDDCLAGRYRGMPLLDATESSPR